MCGLVRWTGGGFSLETTSARQATVRWMHYLMCLTHMPQSKQSRKASERGHTERCATACESLTGDLKRLGKRRHTQWCCTLPAASCVSMRREVGARAPASYVMKLLFGAGGSEIPSQARSAKQHSYLDYRLARVEIQCLRTPPLETSSTGRA